MFSLYACYLYIQLVYEIVQETFILKIRTDYRPSVRAHDILGPGVRAYLNYIYQYCTTAFVPCTTNE